MELHIITVIILFLQSIPAAPEYNLALPMQLCKTRINQQNYIALYDCNERVSLVSN